MGVIPIVRVLPDVPVVQRAAAEEVAARIEAAVRAHGVVFAALSRGSTLRGLYPSQVIRPAAGSLIWLVDRAAAARLTARAGL